MVIPNVDGYTKTLNHRQIHRKRKKININLLKTKIIIKPKYKLSGTRLLHSAFQGAVCTPIPVSYATLRGPVKF